jgi:pSer/pThr/pTyr-binding forkhead associated (FHA) protein
MKANLDYIESRLQAIIENTVRIFNHENISHPLAHQLVNSMRDSVREINNERILAPEIFTILVNPTDLPAWQNNVGLLDSLTQVLIDAALKSGLIFLNPPVIRLSADPEVPVKQTRVTCSQTKNDIASTSAVQILPDQPHNEKDPRPSSAFLIINGSIFPLRLVVINIGRRLDNHLVIDDPRVSRAHAQLRAIHGHFILFDLNSTGGTYINGIRITQQTLKAGDVVSLSGFAVIYGEDSPSEDNASGKILPEEANSHTAPMN